VRLDEQVVQTPQPLGQHRRERTVDGGACPTQRLERVAVKGERLAVCERLDRGAPASVREQRELAERVARADDCEEHALAARRRHPHSEVAARDQMKGVCRVVVVILAAAVAASGASAKRMHRKSVRSHAQVYRYVHAPAVKASSRIARRAHRGLY